MSSSKGENHGAILEEKGSQLTVKAREIPSPGPNDVVVKVHAAAVNPVDHIQQSLGLFVQGYPVILGSDVGGVVHSTGSSVSHFKEGDRVCGFANSINRGGLDNGCFQEYCIIPDINLTKLPSSTSFEEGAVLPMAIATAGLGIFVDMGIPRSMTSAQQDSSFLVWGAASSVGSMAVQIAKNLGFKVYATASPAQHDYIKSLGASEVWDYKDPEIASKIVTAAKDGPPIRYGYDAATKGDTSIKTASILASSGGKGSKLVIVLPWPEEGSGSKPEGVEVVTAAAYKVGTEETETGAWLFNEFLQTKLQEKAIVPSPKKIETIEGGVKNAQKALDKLRAGVSGTKVVLKIE